jgi:hypothetical protein
MPTGPAPTINLEGARPHHRRRPLLFVATHPDPEGYPGEDPTGPGARAATAATEALRTAAGQAAPVKSAPAP